MEKRCLLGLFCALCWLNCNNASSTGDSTPNAGTAATTATIEATTQSPDVAMLTIHGKDIWVRDSSSTGPVIMKLNEGDRCRVLQKGHWELIRGVADYWYQVEFEGKQGWVFGAQTDRMGKGTFEHQALSEGLVPIKDESKGRPKGLTLRGAWEAFRNYKQDLCEISAAISEENSPEHWLDGHGCELKHVSGTDFSLHEFNEGGYYHQDFKYESDTVAGLWLIPVDCNRGAATYCEMSKTLVGYRSDGNWTLIGLIDGQADAMVNLSKDTVLLAFRNVSLCMGMFVEWEIDIWRWIPSIQSFQFLDADVFTTEIEDEAVWNRFIDTTDENSLPNLEAMQDLFQEWHVRFLPENRRLGLQAQGESAPKQKLWWNPWQGRFLPD
jgi:hypothetical protein